MDLGRALQRQVEVEKCVVKMSQPHIHRGTGPMFKLGAGIVAACELKESTTYSMAHRKSVASEQTAEYKRKKEMSAKIFRYVMEAEKEQLVEMGLEVDCELQQQWKEKIGRGELDQLHDLGDAMLHGLSEILCGASNYRPLTPVTPTLHVNRTVVISVHPDKTYWIVLNCTWNLFTIENVGVYESKLVANVPYKSTLTVDGIAEALDRGLSDALRQPQQSSMYAQVEVIKVIVKQIREDASTGLTPAAAGALTNSTVDAMKKIGRRSG